MDELKDFFQNEKTKLQQELQEAQHEIQSIFQLKTDLELQLKNSKLSIDELHTQCQFLEKKLSLDLDQLKDDMDS